MKIGIFGGTFDPIHRGHFQLAQKARSQFSLDKVIFVPAYHPPHKKGLLLAPAADRYEMVRLAIEGEPFFELSDSEIQRKGASYTIDTLCDFEKKYPGSSFFLLLGKDAFGGIDTWERAAELKKKVRFLVANRDINEIHPLKDAHVEWIQMSLCPISASGIREAVKHGRDVADHVSPKVLQYIRKHGLYREN